MTLLALVSLVQELPAATPIKIAFLIELQLSLRGESNEILSQAMTELMVTPVLVDGYGLGLTLSEVRGEPYFGHDGAGYGFSCRMVARRHAGVGAVVMTNSEGGHQVIADLIAVIGTRERWPGY